jgi:cytochrome c-type biogenesis protein CcmE
MSTGRKLAIVSMLVAGAIAYLTYLGAAESWQYYLTVDECLKDVSLHGGTCLRINGKIAGGSLQIATDRRQVVFMLQGDESSLAVNYSGSIPDNLAENMAVVVEGHFENETQFHADKILTRCASKYKSKNSSSAIVPKSKPEAAL